MATIGVGDTTLYYRETGTGSPLLLIHGAGAHADLFDGAVRSLAQHHRVIAYDRRGHSRSGAKPAAVRGYLKQQAEDAAGLLRALGATPVTVVGWSMGGVIGLCLALEHPELVTRLVVCEPPLHASKHVPASSLWPFLKAQFLAAIGRKRAAAETFLRMMLVQPDGSNGYDNVDSATREGVLANVETLLHELKTGTGEELTPERIAELRCPITAILGSTTPAVFSEATARLLQMLPQMRVVRISDAGHIGVMTHPEDFARLALQT
ncbi:MAG TPA: alpha/beta hydrolase [Polyangiaceae bacterium]|nr:alpha/beta hydrolase [Polyangiaceae bacterium]